MTSIRTAPATSTTRFLQLPTTVFVFELNTCLNLFELNTCLNLFELNTCLNVSSLYFFLVLESGINCCFVVVVEVLIVSLVTVLGLSQLLF